MAQGLHKENKKHEFPLQLYEREFFLYRILSGKIRIKYDNKTLEIIPPTLDLMFEGSEIYYQYYNKSKNDGIITQDDLQDYLLNNEIISADEKDLYDKLPNEIDKLKIDLYKNFFRDKSKKIREKLKIANDKYNEISRKLHSYDYTTCEGIANYSKWSHIIYHTTYYKNKRFNWKRGHIDTILGLFYENLANDSTIRLLAHTAPWDMMWSTTKHNFGINATLEQQKLMYWSKFYDNIHEASECPLQVIIDDDDALDGWLIFNKKNRERQAKQDSFAGKKSDHKEIFIPVNSLEELREVQDLNDDAGLNKIKTRMEAIKTGPVKEQDLPDVKRQLELARNGIC